MVTQILRLAVRNDISEIGRVTTSIQKFSEESQLAADLNFNLQVVAEEILSNIIRYGYTDARYHTILFDLQFDSEDISMLIQDDGIPFNMLEHPVYQPPQSMNELKVGGLGIHFVRNMMDEITYRREDGQNILLLKKKTTKA